MAIHDEIHTIINALIDVTEKFFKYDERRKKVLADMRGKALEEAIAAGERDLKAATQNNVLGMRACVRRMIEEVKDGNRYDVNDDTINNAAELLKNKGMSQDAASAIIREFSGRQVALQILKAASAEEYRGLFDYFIFDPLASLEKINSTIDQLTYDNGQNFPGLVSSIREMLITFADRMGIMLNTPYKAEQLEEMRMRNIVGLMGLNYDDVKNM